MGTVLGFFVLAAIAYVIHKRTGLSLTKFVEKKYAQHHAKSQK
ncbi:hypothetical protein [uncultured Vibrio sp.]|nr:hypothetical protein [uncultured Vibrio sp.]